MSVRILGMWTMATAPVAAMALGAAGCGDDGGGGGGGTLGETVVATQNDFGDAACGCFDSLATDFESRGNCIDTLVLGTDEEMCIATAVDEIVGVQPTRECVIDAQETFIRCIDDGGCDGAAACESTYLSSVNDDCPRPSAAAQENFSDSVNDCLGIEPMTPPDGVCPQGMFNADIGGTISGSTAGLGNDFAVPMAIPGACGPVGVDAADFVFTWSAPAAGSFEFTLDQDATTFDAVLLGIDGCGENPALQACADDPGDSLVVCSAPSGATVTVVVDGRTADEEGDFVIDVTAADPEDCDG